jgi:hypothetical protein
MHAIPLLIALFFAAPADAGEYETKLAIALALADTDEPAQVSVVKDHVAQPRKKVEQAYREVKVTKTRRVWGKISCNRNGCRYGWINERYTVTERVPVTKTGGYPTTPKQKPWTQGGRKITWKHLLEGQHRKENFDPGWLKTLSEEEIQQIHADCHENKLKTEYVVRKY